ncbi:MAG: prolyl oligopeptidase family serine peptidase, partial [Myxococcota bacterium]|nr:prolyl oligopeptidase family serine peptidase [Myxococcota bacterium]
GETYPEAIEGTAGAVAWATDNRTVFYVKRDPETLRAHQVWRHELGTDPHTDVMVYEETDDTFYVTVYRSKSKKYLVIHSESTLVSEARFLSSDDPMGEFTVFLTREDNHEYSIDHAGDSFYVRTNWKAKNFRLMRTPEDQTMQRRWWTELIPNRDDVFLHAFELFKDHLVVNERSGGLRGLRVIPWSDTTRDWSLEFDEPVYTATLGTNPAYESTVLRFSYASLTTPSSVYEVDLETRETTLKKQELILGGFEREDYVSERLTATAADGTLVPISLVYRKDLDRTKPQPLYQYGYGSYGYSMDPYFSAARLSLLDRGFIYAIAHIRGGQEFGRAWYEDGKLLKKKNTFTDFIDCGRHLIEAGYTKPDLLVASGGSAGGLLVGAVANMAPEQYAAVVAHVPFVDVVTTMLDDSIPLTTNEYDEWGNPNE